MPRQPVHLRQEQHKEGDQREAQGGDIGLSVAHGLEPWRHSFGGTGAQIEPFGREMRCRKRDAADFGLEHAVLADRLHVQVPFPGRVEAEAPVGPQNESGAVMELWRQIIAQFNQKVCVAQGDRQSVLFGGQPVR